MTEKSFCLSTFFQIKYFRFQFIFCVKIATPPLKIQVLSSPPLLKIWLEVQPSTRKEGGAHYNGGNRTILRNLEKQFKRVVKLKPNLCTTYIERRDRQTGMAASIKQYRHLKI